MAKKWVRSARNLNCCAKHCNLPRHARQLLPHDLTHRRAVAYFSLAHRELSAAQRMDLDDGPANAPAYAQRPDTLRQLRACKFCKLIKTLDQVRPSARFGVDGAPAGRARAKPPIATGSRDFRPDFFSRSPHHPLSSFARAQFTEAFCENCWADWADGTPASSLARGRRHDAAIENTTSDYEGSVGTLERGGERRRPPQRLDLPQPPPPSSPPAIPPPAEWWP